MLSSRAIAEIYARTPGALDMICRVTAVRSKQPAPVEPSTRKGAGSAAPRSSLSPDLLVLLVAVRDNAQMSQRGIAATAGQSKSSASRRLALLVRDGLLERSGDGFALTPAGQLAIADGT